MGFPFLLPTIRISTISSLTQVGKLRCIRDLSQAQHARNISLNIFWSAESSESGWQLTRRMFLVDKISGVESDGKATDDN